MQQKTKFIIVLTFICFVSLLFLPVKAWGVNTQPAGGGGGSCVPQCKTMWYYDDPYTAINPQRHYYCKEYYPLPPECTATTATTKEKDNWCCNNSTGTCYKCSKTGAWSTLSQCEACCPSGTYLECRPPLTTFWGADANKLYCKLATWCEVDPGDECSPQNSVCPASTPTPTTPKYSCNTSTWTCSQDSNGVYSSLSTCQSNCIKPSTTRYSCNTSTWTCFVNPNSIFSLAECKIVCQPGGILSCPGNDYCYACNKTTYQCYQISSGTYSTLSGCQNFCKAPSAPGGTTTTTTIAPPAPKCQIIEFSLNGKTNEDRDPLLVWVGSVIKGLVSTNTSCKTCTVESDDTWGNPSQEYTMALVNGYKAEEKFKIPTSGTYSFDLKCIGNPADPDDSDEDTTSLKAVQAINLPWWREIIPVLPGFLGGI